MCRMTAPAKPEVSHGRLGRERAGTLVGAAVLAALGNQHGELERLLMIQARIYARAVGTLQVLVSKPARTSGALGDVLAGELDVHPAQVRAHVSVNTEREIELLEDILETPRLDSTGSGLGVAVHGIAHPQHRLSGLADRFDGFRQ